MTMSDALFLVTSDSDDVMHLLLAGLSVVLMLVSVNAYRKKPESRYLLLMFAFVFLCLDQIVTAYQEFYLGGNLIELPFLNLHLIHLIELLMILSFLAALVKPLTRGAAKP
jgi:hypothetical protein